MLDGLVEFVKPLLRLSILNDDDFFPIGAVPIPIGSILLPLLPRILILHPRRHPGFVRVRFLSVVRCTVASQQGILLRIIEDTAEKVITSVHDYDRSVKKDV